MFNCLGVKKDGQCPRPDSEIMNQYTGNRPCPKDCRFSNTDQDCVLQEKCCPTPCSDTSYVCIDPVLETTTAINP